MRQQTGCAGEDDPPIASKQRRDLADENRPRPHLEILCFVQNRRTRTHFPGRCSFGSHCLGGICSEHRYALSTQQLEAAAVACTTHQSNCLLGCPLRRVLDILLFCYLVSPSSGGPVGRIIVFFAHGRSWDQTGGVCLGRCYGACHSPRWLAGRRQTASGRMTNVC